MGDDNFAAFIAFSEIQQISYLEGADRVDWFQLVNMMLTIIIERDMQPALGQEVPGEEKSESVAHELGFADVSSRRFQ